MLNAVQGADLGTVRIVGAVQSLLLLLIVRMNIYSKYFFFLDNLVIFSFLVLNQRSCRNIFFKRH